MLLADLFKETKYGRSNKGEKIAKEISEEVDKFVDLTTSIFKTAKELNIDNPREVSNIIDRMTEKFNEQLSTEYKKVDRLEFKDTPAIKSIEFHSYNNSYTKYTNSSSKILKSFRTDVPGIIDVAEKLGLIVIPHQYVKRSLIEEQRIEVDGYNWNISSAYDRFVKQSKDENMNAWLVCPIQYYDIERHAKDLSYELFIPSSISQAFTSIKIILPMLVGMIDQIEKLQKEVSNINTQLDNIRCTLKAQQQQIDRLESELVKERQRRVAEEIRVRKLEAELAEQRAQIQWTAFDPIQIAVPDTVKDINTYEGNAVLGVAWGPEVDDMLVELLGMSKQATRKNFVAQQYERFKY